MKPARPLLAAVLATGCLLSAAPATNAQAPSAPPPQANTPQLQTPDRADQSGDIPDQKLDAAAAAVQRVANLRQNYENQIAAAAPSDRERIASETNAAMTKAVTDQGLTVEEYTAILKVAQSDPGVREKIRQRLPSNK